MNEEKNSVQKMAEIMALLFYHISKEVIDTFGEEGKKALERAIEKFGSERGENIRKDVLSRGLPLTLENLSKYYDMPLKEAWKSKGQVDDRTCYSEVTFCPFAKVWKEKNAEEIGLIYCEQDVALMKAYNPDVEFKRPKNVLKGDEVCLFDVRLKTKN